MKITTYEGLIQDLMDNKISMVPHDCFKTILNHYGEIQEIEGDIIECGVWRGGFSIFLSYVFPDKNIWVCDSFEGFQPVEEAKYGYTRGERHHPKALNSPWGSLAVSLGDVQSNFQKYGLENQDRIKFVKGFVKDTLPTLDIEKISLLRIDVDSYSATLEVLNELYDKVQPGGYIIFDDSCLIESLDAIKTFLYSRDLPFHFYHPATNEKLEIEQFSMSEDGLYPEGCYIIK